MIVPSVRGALLACILLTFSVTFCHAWTKMPGFATDIAIGNDGSVFVLGTSSVEGGYSIHKWTGQGWITLPGGATAISVAVDGSPWIVNNNGDIFRYREGGWQLVQGKGWDVDISEDGTVWVTGVSACHGGRAVYKKTNAGWINVGGCAYYIAADKNDVAWVANKNREIFKYSGGGWIKIPGTAMDIDVGGDGSVWVVGTSLCSDRTGYKIYKYNGSGWTEMDGCGALIAVGPSGNLWVLNLKNEIWRR